MNWRAVRFLTLLVLVGLGYAYTWFWLYKRWSDPDSFFAHGFIVPVVFLWLLHRRKACLKALQPAPDLRGLFLIVPALLLHLAAMTVEVYSPSGFTLPILVAGLIVYFWGWGHLKLLLFPVIFLFFAIPLPLNWVHDLSFRLKIIAVQLSTMVASLTGIEARMEGSFIYFTSGEHLLVGSPCSGLRSLIALLALGFLYAVEFLPLNRLGRIVFIILAGPIAMISNVIRISFLCVLGGYCGVETTEGAVHDLSGYAIYVIALILMIVLGRLMGATRMFKGRPQCEQT